ncbi:MAG TPA: DUF502 domain-containing protein, partial [Alphaproteobacteria bacterium]|nr:DUF502 domain-containing protein [Alphaproteobacteria bacterium]
VGNAVVRAGETVLARMPVVRGLYTATKQIFQTVLSNRSNAFREVVMIQWPREGVWTIGFVSTPPNRQIQSYVGDDVVSVFITTTPIPTYGYLMFVKRSEVRPVDMSVDEAMKIIISGGLVMPPDREMAVSKPAPADGAAAPAPGLAEQTAR